MLTTCPCFSKSTTIIHNNIMQSCIKEVITRTIILYAWNPNLVHYTAYHEYQYSFSSGRHCYIKLIPICICHNYEITCDRSIHRQLINRSTVMNPAVSYPVMFAITLLSSTASAHAQGSTCNSCNCVLSNAEILSQLIETKISSGKI